MLMQKAMLNISKRTFYKLKTESINNSKRTSKITQKIKFFIVTYVTTKINFDYRVLIKLIHDKFKISISKSTIYNILKNNKIRKKKTYTKMISPNKEKR